MHDELVEHRLSFELDLAEVAIQVAPEGPCVLHGAAPVIDLAEFFPELGIDLGSSEGEFLPRDLVAAG